MKQYYFNPKSQDVYIFDSVTKDMLILERIDGVRAITSSEIEKPVDDDGKRTQGANIGRQESGSKVRLCKVCGKPGRADYHDKQGLHATSPL